MCHYESCGNDQKAVAADVPCRRNFYLAVAECSDIDRWYNIALRDWMVYENRDILFCFSYPIKEMVALLMILLAGSILVPEIFFKKFYGKADTK